MEHSVWSPYGNHVFSVVDEMRRGEDMARSNIGLLLMMVLLLLSSGCSSEPGIDAKTIANGPKRRVFPDKSEVVANYIAKLKIRGRGELDPAEKKKYCRNLARFGVDATAALPTLEALAANDQDKRVREVAREAVDSINSAEID